MNYECMENAVTNGQLDELKYLVEEVKVSFFPGKEYIKCARYYGHPDCEKYLLEKGCPEPTDEEYAEFVEDLRPKKAIKRVPAPKRVPFKKAPAKKKAALKKYASRKLQNALQKVDLEDH